MRSSAGILVGVALGLWSSLAAAQSNLGELLDAGAMRLTSDQFKREVVQRTVVGSTPAGGTLEVMYAANGAIEGYGSPSQDYRGSPISGDWTIGDNDRICAAMRLDPRTGTVLPIRCQAWFKLGNDYFISDSDSDRRAKVLRRTIKPASAVVAAPSDLGQLLDARAKKLSADEFKRDVALHTVVGPMPETAGSGLVELMYAANGVIQGVAQPVANYPWNATVTGDWALADGEKICTTMQIRGGNGSVTIVPRQCQLWFKLGTDYFVANSDSDRRAKVLRRTIKP